jgi:hypothetical protein
VVAVGETASRRHMKVGSAHRRVIIKLVCGVLLNCHCAVVVDS